MTTQPKPKQFSLADSLLIATPRIDEESVFQSALVYIFEHSSTGDVSGLIVNKASDTAVEEIIKSTPIAELPHAKQLAEAPIYLGGPVNTSRVYCIYEEATKDQTPGQLAVGGNSILEKIATGKGPRNYLVMRGCAMWANGQLEKELLTNSWLKMPSSPAVVFSDGTEEKCVLAARQMGFNLNMLHG